MAGAGGYAQMGTALSGDIVGGIGSLIAAENYRRPRLPPATGPELRLRQLAQSQLLGGGQQLLGATALYNQLAPILMSQLPGMHYTPGTVTAGMSGGQDGTGTGGTSGGGTNPMSSYQEALQNYRNQQGLVQQRSRLKAQLKGAKGKAARQPLRQQLRGVKQSIKALPPINELERQQYLGGVQQDPSMFNTGMSGAPAGSMDSLGSINDLMAQNPDLLSAFRGSLGGGSLGDLSGAGGFL